MTISFVRLVNTYIFSSDIYSSYLYYEPLYSIRRLLIRVIFCQFYCNVSELWKIF